MKLVLFIICVGLVGCAPVKEPYKSTVEDLDIKDARARGYESVRTSNPLPIDRELIRTLLEARDDYFLSYKVILSFDNVTQSHDGRVQYFFFHDPQVADKNIIYIYEKDQKSLRYRLLGSQ